MCLAQGHNTVMPMRFEPEAPRSRVEHFTTELLRSIYNGTSEVYYIKPDERIYWYKKDKGNK